MRGKQKEENSQPHSHLREDGGSLVYRFPGHYTYGIFRGQNRVSDNCSMLL